MNKLPLLALSIILAGCSCPFAHRSTTAYPNNQTIQKITDEAVTNAKESLHPKGMAVIVAEPKTGKILAISGNGTGVVFEPGSTIKPVVVVAALEEGKITPKTKINCENGQFNYKGKTIRDHIGFAELTFDKILSKSSNIGASKMALLFKDQEYFNWVRRFGFGEKTGIAIQGEIPGLMVPLSYWGEWTKARMAFGQSIAVTPIQLTMAYCALANGGKLMKPVIGDEKPVVVRRVCSKGTADAVKNALALVVSDQGTAPLAQVKGVTVGGKTGTSQAITPEGRYSEGKYVASFVGFFPVEKPRYVCLVVVDQADLKPERNFGGLVAAPIFSEVAGKVLANDR